MEKKRSVIIVAAAAVIVAAVAVGYLVYLHSVEREEAKISGEIYREDETRHYSMGESFVISSDVISEGEEYDYASNVDWSGSMRIKLESAEWYDSLLEADIDKSLIEGIEGFADDNGFMQCEIEIENIDAESIFSERSSAFNISVLNLYAPEALHYEPNIPEGMPRGFSFPYRCIYFDGTRPEAGVKGMFEYTLAKGEKKTFILGYLVPSSDATASFVIGVGASWPEKNQIAVKFETASSDEER